MPRDHMLGWPPALLALDPSDFPRKVERTTRQPRLTDREQELRRGVDKLCTSQLEGPKAAPAASALGEAATTFVPEYFRGNSGVVYRTSPSGPKGKAEKFKGNAWVPCDFVLNSDFMRKDTYKSTPCPPEGVS